MDFQFSRARDLDLDNGSGHTAYHCASVIDLYLHAKFNLTEMEETYVRTYGRTDICHFIKWTQKSRP